MVVVTGISFVFVASSRLMEGDGMVAVFFVGQYFKGWLLFLFVINLVDCVRNISRDHTSVLVFWLVKWNKVLELNLFLILVCFSEFDLNNINVIYPGSQSTSTPIATNSTHYPCLIVLRADCDS